MDFKERFKDRTAFFKRDGSVNQQGENITLLAGSANPNSRLAQERAENGNARIFILSNELSMLIRQDNQANHKPATRTRSRKRAL